MTLVDLKISTSTSLHDKSDYALKKHFRWESIKKFVYLAFTYSSTTYNFDIFSKVQHDCVRLFDFLFFEITMGMTYMFMDVFIKQYTRKIHCNQLLNPLLRGITIGCMLQSLMWNVFLAADLADSLRYLIAGLHHVTFWSKCQETTQNGSCLPTELVIIFCRNQTKSNLTVTSVHFNYQTYFTSTDRSDITSKMFVIIFVWTINFFVATITDDSLVKLFRIASLWRMCSTVFVLVFSLLSTKYFLWTAISQMFDVTAPRVYASAIDRVTFSFGIGLVGVYDFGTMSAHTMVDNAVVIFTIVFTILAFARSLIIRILYLALTRCVIVKKAINTHYLLFALLPLSAEFMQANKIYTIYIYENVISSLVAYLAMLTLTMSKILHSEFRSVKNVYLVGILCFLSCNLSFPIAMLPKTKLKGILLGMNLTVLYLGGFKVAVIMWLYGVDKFSTDVQFSLGFKPTRFWTVCWVLFPILTFIFIIQKIYILVNFTETVQMILASIWIIFSLLLVTIIQGKTIARYIVRNNLVGVFKCSPKYGPPDPEDRLRRRKFDVALLHHQCVHDCIIVDEKLDCNHLPLMFKNKARLESISDTSLTNIFEAGPSTIKTSAVLDITQMHNN
ncbi:unnamed protein product [Parnassius mnemosyne]|uniref:Uncharacterized protein n=1 Tax=Parnassius mnemosyne TaxID=213953 RepID=A0AAV1L3I4_9NEOP